MAVDKCLWSCFFRWLLLPFSPRRLHPRRPLLFCTPSPMRRMEVSRPEASSPTPPAICDYADIERGMRCPHWQANVLRSLPG